MNPQILSEDLGMKGHAMIHRAFTSLRLSYSTLPHFSLSSLMSFQGMQELKYSLLKWASAITSWIAFLKSQTEMCVL